MNKLSILLLLLFFFFASYNSIAQTKQDIQEDTKIKVAKGVFVEIYNSEVKAPNVGDKTALIGRRILERPYIKYSTQPFGFKDAYCRFHYTRFLFTYKARYTGKYIFATRYTGSSRLFIDNLLVINDWNNLSVNASSTKVVVLDEGRHDMLLEHWGSCEEWNSNYKYYTGYIELFVLEPNESTLIPVSSDDVWYHITPESEKTPNWSDEKKKAVSDTGRHNAKKKRK